MATKACDVTQLPPGLRQDADIQDGVYVGRRLNHFRIGWSQDPKEDQIELGNCQTPPPQTTYVDDKNGVVYLPTGEDCYKKLDEENGIGKEYGFGKRASGWWRSLDLAGPWKYIPSLRYLFFGAPAVRNADQPNFSYWSEGRGDHYADVLDHAEEVLQKKPDRLAAAAVHWLGEDSAYGALAEKWAVRLADNPNLDVNIRIRAAGKLAGSEKEADRREKGLQVLRALATDRKVASEARLEAAGQYQMAFPPADEAKAAPLYLSIFEDPNVAGSIRYDALKNILAFENGGENYRKVVSVVLNWQGDAETRYRVVPQLTWHGIPKEEKDKLFTAFYQTAIDPKTEADHRFYAWKFVKEFAPHPGKEREAAAALLRMARSRRIPAEYRYRAGQEAWLSCHRIGDDAIPKKEALAATTELLRDPKIDIETRYAAGDFLMVATEDPAAKQVALTDWSRLLDEEGLADGLRLNIAENVFAKSREYGALTRAIAVYLNVEAEEGEDGLDEMWKILERKVTDSDRHEEKPRFTKEGKLQRLHLILEQIGYGPFRQNLRVNRWIEAVEREPSPQTPDKQKGRLVVEVTN